MSVATWCVMSRCCKWGAREIKHFIRLGVFQKVTSSLPREFIVVGGHMCTKIRFPSCMPVNFQNLNYFTLACIENVGTRSRACCSWTVFSLGCFLSWIMAFLCRLWFTCIFGNKYVSRKEICVWSGFLIRVRLQISNWNAKAMRSQSEDSCSRLKW